MEYRWSAPFGRRTAKSTVVARSKLEGLSAPLTNSVLVHLPGPELEALKSKLLPLLLPRGTVLLKAGADAEHVYLLQSGIASVDFVSRNGQQTCVNLVGADGLIGIAATLGETRVSQDVCMRVSGSGFRMLAANLRTLCVPDAVLTMLCRQFTRLLLAQSQRFTVCQHHHSVQERLADRILYASQVAAQVELDFTQEGLAAIVGCTRPTITIAAQALRQLGAIDYRRGRMVVADEARLRESACECARLREVLGWKIAPGNPPPAPANPDIVH